MSDDFSPYAPPQSAMADSPKGAVTEREKIDIGEAFNFVLKDPDWLARCLTMGLVMLIPILGMIMLMGWQVRVFEAVQRGETGLPDVDLGGDLSRGVAPFVALFTTLIPIWLVLVVMYAAVMIPLVLIGEGGGGDAVGALMGVMMMFIYAAQMLLSLGINVVMPEIYRRGLSGEMVPLLSIGESFRDIKGNFGQYFVAFLGWFVASLAASFGVFLCFVGMFLTFPASIAMQGHLAAQWDQVARRGR